MRLARCARGSRELRADVRGALLERVVVSLGSDVALEDVVVQRTRSNVSARRFGIGLAVGGEGRLAVVRGVLARNRTLGVLVDGANARVELADVAIRDTLPSEADGEYGMGVALSNSASLRGERCLVENNFGAGIGLQGRATLDLRSSDILRTRLGTFTETVSEDDPTGSDPGSGGAPGRTYAGIGDGILARESTVKLDDVRTLGCARAGVLVAKGDGAIARLMSQGNDIGIALTGGSAPSLDEATCSIDRNLSQDVLREGVLPVPTAPAAMPPPLPSLSGR